MILYKSEDGRLPFSTSLSTVYEMPVCIAKFFEKSSKIFFKYAELLVFEIGMGYEIKREPVEEALPLYQKCLDADDRAEKEYWEAMNIFHSVGAHPHA